MSPSAAVAQPRISLVQDSCSFFPAPSVLLSSAELRPARRLPHVCFPVFCSSIFPSEQLGDVFVFALFRTKMHSQTVDRFLAVPHRENRHFAPSRSYPYRFSGKTHQPCLIRAFYPPTRLTGKLNHWSLPNMRVVKRRFRSDVGPDKRVVLAGSWSRVPGRLYCNRDRLLGVATILGAAAAKIAETTASGARSSSNISCTPLLIAVCRFSKSAPGTITLTKDFGKTR